ncbi:MAG: hypothetical protein QXX29_00420 [Nitrososphaerota archaeon]
MNLETWLLISVVILVLQYAAMKISEKGLSRRRQAWTEPAAPLEQAQAHGEMPEEELPGESGLVSVEAEQESIGGQEVMASESLEESGVEEPAATAQSIGEIELIAAKISELKDLLEMSKELRKELQKLAETLDPAKSRKRVN